MKFHRLAIVNRGESAMRALNAVAELNRENGAELRTIALYTEADRHAWFVREADEAVSLGPATFLDPKDGRRKHAYLDYERLENALLAARAEAVWVGWGFVAEHADFADLCKRLGIVFVGPDGDVMRRLGDKIESKRLAESAGVPVLPWSGGPVNDLETALAKGAELGYPLFTKATAGGGGRGIRRVNSEAELAAAFESARAEAGHAFGDPTVFLERQVLGARHIEVQVIADRHGEVWAPGVRDCTIQRRNQKVVEESASTALDVEQDSEVRAAAIRLCRAAGYHNAGTVEFLYEPSTRSFMFMEVNARLQVEHPVTELTTGLDLVKLQLHVANDGRLDGEVPPVSGHAIEVRLNAEDPDNNFAPSPGRIAFFRPPAGPGVRVDTGVTTGDQIAPEFDSMIAKIIAWGRDRNKAIARLSRALAQTTVIVEGGKTNKAFLLTLLGHPDVRAGRLDTGWLDRISATGELLSRQYADIAVLQAAVEAYDVERELAESAFYASATRGRPEPRLENGHKIAFRYRGTPITLRVFQLGPRSYRVAVDGRIIDVAVEPLSRYERRINCLGRDYKTVSVVQGPVHTVEVEGVTHTIARDDGGIVRATSPGVVVSVNVNRGDEVAVGDTLAVLETMKMESPVLAAFAGRVRSTNVKANDQIDAGQPLLEIEPLTAESETERAEAVRLEFAEPPSTGAAPDTECGRMFDSLRSYMLGYDLDAKDAKQLFGRQQATCAGLPADDPEVLAMEDELLELFADLCILSQRQPEPSDEAGEQEQVRAPQEYFFTYLRSLDKGRETLPSPFLDRLRRGLARYGVDSLDRSPQLEESLVWMYRSQLRLEEFVPVMVSILDRRLLHRERLIGRVADPEKARALLDRLQTAAEGRYPTVSDLAREVEFRWFDEPVLDVAREKVYVEMDAHLEALGANPMAPDREQRIAALVACPQPMRALLQRWYRKSVAGVCSAVLEASMRRYYRIRNLENITIREIAGHQLATAEYDHDGARVHLVMAYGEVGGLPGLIAAVRRQLEGVPEDSWPVFDVHLWQTDPLPDEQTTEQRLRTRLEEGAAFGRPMHRIDATIASDPRGDQPGTTYHFTWRSADGAGVQEDPLYRNMHPMLGKRLELWRLQNFAINRVESVEDVYLFHGVAHSNPKDERLFALAEVRDITPVRDQGGRVVSVPLLERMLVESFAAIRRFQSHRPPTQRLVENRVVLYIRPPWDIPPELWRDIAHKLAPVSHGLNLEKVVARVKLRDPDTGQLREQILQITNPGSRGVVVRRGDPDVQPIRPLDEYRQKVLKTVRRGATYPYELIKMLTPPVDAESDFPSGDFVEYDLDEANELVRVDRPYGLNAANLVVGVIRNTSPMYPEGMKRVIVLGDPSRSLGSLAEAECRRIIAALDLAEQLRVPLEWFAVSSGARISMTSGTENMDWIAAVLRRLVEFTQGGGEVNVIVTGINVGAQPYWNAEATMLMHTRGILVMIPESAMVLTGKQALDFSGGVSAEDNLGIGGYERIMGPNGQAQYWAPDLPAACELLFQHYDYTYVAPGESFPRRATTADPPDRDVRGFPHAPMEGSDFTTVGDVFSDEKNPERKKAFDMRSVMRSVSDQDFEPLERWKRMSEGGEMGIVWDVRIGGMPVCVIGLESRNIQREGFVPIDGPTSWTSGTLFPRSSKKVARAINGASGNRPVVVLANLSGFDGSPESMRDWQLEYGAEIGRAVTNFKGPIVFVVVSRYHGGAFVVFSKPLNESLEIAAVEGSYASVIGGAPAAAAVFAQEVNTRTKNDPRVVAMSEAIAKQADGDAQRLRLELRELSAAVRSEKLGEVAEEFDGIHSIQRALKVGSVDRIIPGSALRPYIIDALERGLARRRQPEATAAVGVQS